jgi:hypothetical protein
MGPEHAYLCVYTFTPPPRSYLEAPDAAGAAPGLAAVARARKMVAASEQDYLAILKKDSTGKKGVVWFKLGQLYGALGKDAESKAKALTAFKRAAAANPDSERFKAAAETGEWRPISETGATDKQAAAAKVAEAPAPKAVTPPAPVAASTVRGTLVALSCTTPPRCVRLMIDVSMPSGEERTEGRRARRLGKRCQRLPRRRCGHHDRCHAECPPGCFADCGRSRSAAPRQGRAHGWAHGCGQG